MPTFIDKCNIINVIIGLLSFSTYYLPFGKRKIINYFVTLAFLRHKIKETWCSRNIVLFPQFTTTYPLHEGEQIMPARERERERVKSISYWLDILFCKFLEKTQNQNLFILTIKTHGHIVYVSSSSAFLKLAMFLVWERKEN